MFVCSCVQCTELRWARIGPDISTALQLFHVFKGGKTILDSLGPTFLRNCHLNTEIRSLLIDNL